MFIKTVLTALLAIILSLPVCSKENGIVVEFLPPKEKGLSGIIRLNIPGRNYIYANPKGEGTGKATEIFLKDGGPYRIRVIYPAGSVHRDPGSSKSVFIYSGIVDIPYSVEGGGENGKASVVIDMLMCSSSTCMPMKGSFEIEFKRNNAGDFQSHGPGGSISPELSGGSGELFSLDSIGTDQGSDEKFTPRFLQQKVTGLWQAILLGIIAGFVLNLMPCVFPVVGLKVMALVKHAGGGRKPVIVHSLVFSAGIISSFLILASLAALGGYQWGGLFQSSYFIFFMILFVTVLSLSMLGLYTINIPGFAARASVKTVPGLADSFVKGLMATLLATPCSGPFLGAVLAWLLLQKTVYIYTVFVSIGTGMALPYMALALRPGLVNRLPSSGQWMVRVEKAMGVLLLGTAFYLLYVMNGGSRYSALLAISAAGVAAFIARKYLSFIDIKFKKTVFFVAMAVFSTGIYWAGERYVFSSSGVQQQAGAGGFTFTGLKNSVSGGKTVVVEFTADWCPNCKVLEYTVFRDSEVRKILGESGTVFLKADITVKGSEGEALLKKLGGRSIPFLAVFPPGKGYTSPICLMDIYSTSDFIRAYNMAKSGK